MISGNTRSQDQSNFFRPNGSIYSVFLRDILNENANSISPRKYTSFSYASDEKFNEMFVAPNKVVLPDLNSDVLPVGSGISAVRLRNKKK